jgi:hypothetical protein
MAEQATEPTTDTINHARIDAALDVAFRDMLLEHARLGRSVCESRDGQVVWVTPAEIFARYGLDENGRPLENEDVDDPNAPPPDPYLVAQLEDWAWLDQLRGEGKLDQYRGEFVLAAEKQIFGHGRDLVHVRPPAEEKARAKGIPPERLLDYFMPGE